MSDGQFSSKPIRPERSRDFARSACEFSAEPVVSTSATQDFLDSGAIAREVNALLQQPLPRLNAYECAPLHRSTPEEAQEMGQPLASAILVQEYLIGLVFLRVAGWFFMPIGLLLILSAFGMLIAESARPRGGNDFGMFVASAIVGGLGLFIAGVGAWFGIFRGRVINERCWLCNRGMIWMTNGAFDWYRWEKIPGLYCSLAGARPAIGIRFERDINWISFANTHSSRMIVAFIETQASAASARSILQLIAEGQTVRFDEWRLSRTSFRGRKDDFAWRDLSDVTADDYEVRLRHREGGAVTIPLENVPYPSLFAALVRGIWRFSNG